MKIICIGRNYVQHIDELKSERPESPVVFLKPDSSVLPNKSPFYIPEFSKEVHYEVELLVKISKNGKYIEEQFAHRYYEEIGLGIDFTARDLQNYLMEKGLPWEKCKGFDGSAVIGNFLPKSDFESVNNITFRLERNAEIVQHSNANKMIWKIDEIVSYVSQYFTLKMGDIIFTGTPEGVAAVAPNDVLEGFINDTKMLRVNIK